MEFFVECVTGIWSEVGKTHKQHFRGSNGAAIYQGQTPAPSNSVSFIELRFWVHLYFPGDQIGSFHLLLISR